MTMHISELSPATSDGAQPVPKLNIFLCDVSGSMSQSMRQLAEDTIKRVKEIPLGDGLLIGIFSSSGWFRWTVALALHRAEDYNIAERIVRQEFYARSTTCFSEILADTPSAVSTIFDRDHYSIITLTFMSDGCPVVPNLAKEDAAMEAAALALQPLITAGSVIAYGDYADRARLTKLATTIGLELVMADTVAQVGESLEKTVKKAPRKRRRVTVPQDAQYIFSLSPDGTVVPLDAKAKEVSATEDAGVYVLSTVGKSTSLDREDIRYAGALALVQDNNTDTALELLSGLGDVALVQSVSQALTNAEITVVEQELKQAVINPKARYTKGKKVGCLPKEDAFDLMDLLNLLMSDEDCKFYPRHPAFQYKRIGRATKTKEGYPKFEADDNVAVPVSRLVGNSSELNLSIGINIPGVIELPEGIYDSNGVPNLRDQLGLPKEYKTNIFRTYSLIADAKLSVTQLPLSFNDETLKVLVAEGLTDGTCNLEAGTPHFKEDLIIVLDLTKVPICNRQRGKDAANWELMAQDAVESLRLGSKVKVWRAKRDELDPGRASEKKVSLTSDQLEFLEACGVRRDGSFGPPVDMEEPTDVLEVRRLEVKVDRGSPVSMKDFMSMVEGKKKFNMVGELMQSGYKQMVDDITPMTRAMALIWLQNHINEVERQKRVIDARLNAQRFAVALTGAWRKHFTEDEVTVSTPGGHPVHLRFDTLTKKI